MKFAWAISSLEYLNEKLLQHWLCILNIAEFQRSIYHLYITEFNPRRGSDISESVEIAAALRSHDQG